MATKFPYKFIVQNWISNYVWLFSSSSSLADSTKDTHGWFSRDVYPKFSVSVICASVELYYFIHTTHSLSHGKSASKPSTQLQHNTQYNFKFYTKSYIGLKSAAQCFMCFRNKKKRNRKKMLRLGNIKSSWSYVCTCHYGWCAIFLLWEQMKQNIRYFKPTYVVMTERTFGRVGKWIMQ